MLGLSFAKSKHALVASCASPRRLRRLSIIHRGCRGRWRCGLGL